MQQLEIKTKMVIPANEEESSVLRLFSPEPVHIDDLARQMGMTAPTAAGTLMMLELKGSVRRVGSMSYVLAH